MDMILLKGRKVPFTRLKKSDAIICNDLNRNRFRTRRQYAVGQETKTTDKFGEPTLF